MAEPNFQIGDKVKVSNPFFLSEEYKDKIGVIVSYIQREGVNMVLDDILYEVEIDNGENLIFSFKELSKVENPS